MAFVRELGDLASPESVSEKVVEHLDFCGYSNAILNYPPFITIFMAGMSTIKNWWFMTLPSSHYDISRFVFVLIAMSKRVSLVLAR